MLALPANAAFSKDEDSPMRLIRTLFAAGAALLVAGAALAQPAPGARQIVRGEVKAVAADHLDLVTREGKPLTVALAPNWNVAVMKPITADAIQPGSFIGTTEMPQADGSGLSLEVHVFPPGLKVGEGHYPWDLQPGSMMTNGTVGKVEKVSAGQALDVSYPNGSRHVVVPPNVPIVQIAGGTPDMVKPGTKVFLIGDADAAGKITANTISVGEAGAAPPM
jgi:hypothetical protein